MPMPPEKIGKFRIESELGTGGMGTVYLAVVDEACAGLDVGETVALKVIHPHLQTRTEFLRRFVREGEVGLEVDHPNVVKTLTVEVQEGGDEATHYLVMEYVQGQTLRDLLGEYGRVPEALLREIARQVCSGLDAIHGVGIVHRDLKPENILITRDHRVRIMDLGVARLVDGYFTPTREGLFAGSLAYAAPEQLRGVDVDPRADLYSFGVLLHELATGENPFAGRELGGIVNAHLNLTPPPVRERVPEVSAFLSEVVALLLEKEPEDRFASAAELQEVLTEAEASAWWAEREASRSCPGPLVPAIPVARETELYAREEDLGRIRAAWRAAAAGDGRVVYVEGEAGIGKTRFLDEFLRGLAGEDCRLLYGSYPPSGGIGGLSGALVDHFGRRGLEDALRPFLESVPRLVPAFASMVVHQAPSPDTETIDGEAVHTVFCELMRGLANDKPLVWVVDDLHFAEPDSRRIILSMARATEGARVLLIGSARPGIPQEETAELSRLTGFRRILLERLGARHVIELLRDAFRSSGLAERLGGKIAYKSDGIPFFVFEMIRELRDRELISRKPDGSFVETRVIADIEVPSAVRDLVEARLQGLTREERAILDVGAVQGYEFDPDLTARVLQMNRIPVLQVLAEVERSSGVVRGEARHCRFDHHQIQEVILEDIPPQLRAEYHTALADAHGDRLGVDPGDLSGLSGDHAHFLAAHHLRGRDPARGIPFLDPALTHLEGLYRHEAALELADRALTTPMLVTGDGRAKLLVRSAGRLGILGRGEEERRALQEAVDLADESGDPRLMGQARLLLGGNLQRSSAYSEANACFREVLDLAVREDILLLEASAKGSLGIVALYLGRQEEAFRFLEDAKRISHELGNADGEARASLSLGNVLLDQGRFDEARAFYEVPCSAEGLGGGERLHVMAVGNMGGTFEAQGRFADALDRYETQMVLSRGIGYRHGEAISLVNLGALFIGLGDLGYARERLEECHSLCRLIGSRRVEGYALHGLALAAEGAGEFDGSLELFDEALALRRDAGYSRGVAETLVASGRLLAGSGEFESARQRLEEALSLAENLGLPNEALRAGALLAVLPRGDVNEARRLFTENRSRAWHRAVMEARFLDYQASADTFGLRAAHRHLRFLCDHAPETYREAMIANVPLHRDITAAWEEHAGA